jgi:hypothetical protein
MNISSGVLWAVLGALYLPGDLIGRASEATLHGDLAFLGPKGSYSDEAASKYVFRAHLDSTTALTTITEIAHSVGESRAEFGLLPYRRITDRGLPSLGYYAIKFTCIEISRQIFLKRFSSFLRS